MGRCEDDMGIFAALAYSHKQKTGN